MGISDEAASDRLGLVYPFPHDTGGRLERHNEFWAEVGRQVATLRPSVLEAWPEHGGVPLKPDASDPAYGAADILPVVRRLAESCQWVALCDMYEPGLAEARAELGNRVRGALESSLETVAADRLRLGFVTARPGVSEAFLRLRLSSYNVEPHTVHALNAWSYDLLLDSITGQDDRMLDDLLRQAAACALDGADVVIPVCIFFGPLLARGGRLEVGGIPVLDPFAVLIRACTRVGPAPSR